MKIRILCLGLMFGLLAAAAYGQQLGRPDANRVGDLEVLATNLYDSSDKRVATELVQTLLVDDFEMAGEWAAFIPRDFGIATAIRREGAPRDLASERNKYVLGVRVEFMKRDWSWVSITPVRPIKIKGLTKTLSCWVVGRNYRHTLFFVIRDYLERTRFVRAEKMIWVGWKKVNVNIPDTIEQENYKVSEERGITFIGFRIDFEPDDMLGRPFYSYYDYLTADTDLFTERNQNPDDMLDNW